MSNLDNELINFGNQIIRKIDYDFKVNYDKFKFFKNKFDKKREDIEIFNNIVYGKK